MKINQIKFTTCPARRCDRRDDSEDSSIKCITSECILPSPPSLSSLFSASFFPLSTTNIFVATCDKQMQFAVELHWLYLIIIFDFFVALCFVLPCLFLGTRERGRDREERGKICTIFVYGGQCTFWLIHQQFRAVEGQARVDKRKCWKIWPAGSSCIESRSACTADLSGFKLRGISIIIKWITWTWRSVKGSRFNVH